jgi:NAD(P)-dependent dehydrogenase (short-subunit alcohol dehydrogenase family)
LVIVPGVGIVALGKTPQEARVTGEFYRNAIRVMRGAESVSRYVALAEQEAFDIEYWALEEAKLRRQPPEKELSRRVALVTGAAQGIGLATALRLAELGSAVVLVDRDSQKLESAREAVLGVCDPDSVVAVTADVSDSATLEGAMESAILAFGGVDIVVANAGVARRGTVADTAPDDYDLLDGVLIRGLYQTVGIAVRWMRAQGLGGSIVVVGSKNGTAAGSNAALYSSAKAFALHLVRCAAVDHAKDGIRVNAVNPDAVVARSGIWSAEWREQTAASLGIRPDEIEEHYRKRSLLGVAVRPEDVAEAVVWLASDRRSSRTTGCVLPVDGGNREGFLR